MSTNHCFYEWSFRDKMTNVFRVQLKCGNHFVLVVPFMSQIITLNVKEHHYVLVKTQCPFTIQTTSETLF